MKKFTDIWFFLAFVAILALDVDNSSTGAVLAVFGNFVAVGGLVYGISIKSEQRGGNRGKTGCEARE